MAPDPICIHPSKKRFTHKPVNALRHKGDKPSNIVRGKCA